MTADFALVVLVATAVPLAYGYVIFKLCAWLYDVGARHVRARERRRAAK